MVACDSHVFTVLLWVLLGEVANSCIQQGWFRSPKNSPVVGRQFVSLLLACARVWVRNILLALLQRKASHRRTGDWCGFSMLGRWHFFFQHMSAMAVPTAGLVIQCLLPTSGINNLVRG